MLHTSFLPSLLPFLAAFQVTAVHTDIDSLTLTLQPTTRTAACPVCREPSSAVHSWYDRTLTDVPLRTQQVRFQLHVRRFFCRTARCLRRIFCERLGTLAEVYQRQTTALVTVLQQIGLALGGKAGARLAHALQMPTSWMTVLRRITSVAVPAPVSPRVLGVDDWAWRKGARYGTILVDLEQQRLVDLLPDRTATTLTQWLMAHPDVEIISRDRASAYAEGARIGAPQAVQVADRFHLVKNIGDVLEQVLSRQHTALRRASAPSVDETPRIEASRPSRRASVQSVQTAKREQRHVAIHELAQHGHSIHAIAKTLGLARNTVRRYLRTPTVPVADMRAGRTSLVTPYAAYLQERWAAGCKNATVLWREITARGFTGGISIVRAYLAPWRGGHVIAQPTRQWSPRQTMWLLRKPDAQRNTVEQTYIKQLLAACPEIAAAHHLTTTFLTLVSTRDRAALESWLEAADANTSPEIRTFAAGIRRDHAAVVAALEHTWNNGMVEGHVNRLKLIKRQGYGRAGFALLRQRVLHGP